MNNEGNAGDGIPQEPPEEGQHRPAQEPPAPQPPSGENPPPTTPEQQAMNIIHAYNQPGVGREKAEQVLRGTMPDEVLEQLLAHIPPRDEIPPRQQQEGDISAPQSDEEESAQGHTAQQEQSSEEDEESGQGDSEPQLSPLAQQLIEMGNRVKDGQGRVSASEALDALPEELRERYKKPLEEMQKVALYATANDVPSERVEEIKKAFTDSDMGLEEAENLLIGTNITDEAKKEIRAKIAKKEEERGRRDDNEGAMEAVSEAQMRLQEANDMIDGSNDLSDSQKEDFRTKLRALNVRLEDAGVKKVIRGVGKGVAVSILMVLIFMIWEMQMIGRVSKKSGR